MYQYDEFDREFISERVRQFRDQVGRRLSGALSEDEFAPLRLQNGLYKQLHAYMLRVAIPYGTLSSQQMLKLAEVAEQFDRGYGHFTTRQNIQFNWLDLEVVPDLLACLAAADMHAIQTSGNCIRNITCDPFAGVAADEITDPRPLAELLRQWSTLHPEFAHLPRKFKIAITAATADRAAIFFHDIGLRFVRDDNGSIGFEIIVGGGQGRTPIIGKVLNPFVPFSDLLPYLESIMRVYNLHGRRDNKYKARIKILFAALGLERFRAEVDADYIASDHSTFELAEAELERIKTAFVTAHAAGTPLAHNLANGAEQAPSLWLKHNVSAHKTHGYAIVTVTLKSPDRAPGDASAAEMRTLAELAAKYSRGELRVSHEQNIVLPYVRRAELGQLWRALKRSGLARANHGLITDIIACPGLDYCTLANARSIPLAKRITERFADANVESAIGPVSIKISGCVNACAHHHAGHIGILGVEKGGREFYQLTLGGSATEKPAIGERLGRAVEADEVLVIIDTLIAHYRRRRSGEETFIQTVNRVGATSFREAIDAARR